MERLANVFGNRQEYETRLKTLWALRRSVQEKMGYPDIDKQHPLFQVLDLTNEIIGAIGDGSVYIVNNHVICKGEQV